MCNKTLIKILKNLVVVLIKWNLNNLIYVHNCMNNSNINNNNKCNNFSNKELLIIIISIIIWWWETKKKINLVLEIMTMIQILLKKFYIFWKLQVEI